LSTWDIDIIVKYIGDNMTNNEDLPLDILQKKTIALISIATMWRPRSDLGQLQPRDVHISRDDSNNVIGVTLFIRFPKESRFKSSRFGLVDNSQLYPVAHSVYFFLERTSQLRLTLDAEHTLFLSHIMDASRCRLVRPPTVANFIKQIMDDAGIYITKHSPHSFRSAVSTKAVCKAFPFKA
jgi:hypothetical protein